MEANPVRAIDYFDGTKQNLIPLFQRQYTWQKEKWQTLWNDILTNVDIGEGSTHFMGAIVSLPVRTVPVGVNKHLVIDGQQRLTTLALLLAALRDILPEEVGARIEDYLVNRHYKDADRLKLVPTHGDRDAFHALVSQKVKEADGHLMKDAYDFFTKALKGNDLNDEPVNPEVILQTVEHALQVVMINLSDTDDPYLIFESLNHKGEPLTQADLVRNYILMRFKHSLESGGDQEKAYFELWKPLQDALGSKLTDFLRHYVMKDGDNIKQGGIYTAMKQRLSAIDNAEGVRQEVAQIRRLGHIYERFVEPPKESRASIHEHLWMLRELEVTTCYPLLLRLCDLSECGELSEEDLRRSLEAIESFVVRRAVCDVPPNSLGRMFLQWSKSLPDEDHYGYLVASLAAGSGNRRWPSDEEFESAFVTSQQYKKKSTRHILIRLEKSFGHKELVDLNLTTIEHVMPQTLTDPWKDMLGPNFKDAHATHLHRFGNLTLTGYNVELGNMPFEKKCEEFEKSHIDLTRALANHDKWDAEEIDNRGKDLARISTRIWPRPFVPTT